MNLSKAALITIGAGILGTGAIVALVIPAARPPAPANAFPPGPTAPANAFPRGPTASAPLRRPDRTRATPPGGSKAKAAQSPYHTALLRYQAEKNWVEFGVLAFNEAERVSTTDRVRTLELLGGHQASGGFPALFCIARHHWFAGNKDEACRWFIKARVVYTIDAQRCTDPTARQAVQAVQAQFAPLAEYLEQFDRQIERQWTQEALEFEDGLADREPARWIAAHGLASFKAKPAGSGPAPDAFLPEDQWRAARERARASIAESLTR